MKGKSWRILRRWFGNIKCCVSLNGKKSAYFPVKRRVQGLQMMIDCVKEYGNKWRFEFNPEKSVVVTFWESTQINKHRTPTHQWFLNREPIKECQAWDHVGITLKGISPEQKEQKMYRKKESRLSLAL
jgi:hypothetical protein